MKQKPRSTLTHLEFITLRREAGFNQTEFADKLGIHRISLSRYENGLLAIPLLVESAARWVAHVKERL